MNGLRLLEGAYDRLDALWKGPRTHRFLGTLLVWTFLGTLVLSGLVATGVLPPSLPGARFFTPFTAVYVAFTLLLVVEVLGLVFALGDSIARSVAKQFEILSLILLRKAFLEFSAFPDMTVWSEISIPLLTIVVDGAGALAVYVLVGFFLRVQRHRPITADEVEQEEFVAWKKAVALGLLATFVGMALHDAWLGIVGDPYPFFEGFYLVLIFSDILLVLLSYRFSSSYPVLFRNSGFALSTVLVRVALSAPAFLNAAIAVGAGLLALGVSLAYNAYDPEGGYFRRGRPPALATGRQAP